MTVSRTRLRRLSLAVILCGAVASLAILISALAPWEAMGGDQWIEAVTSLSMLLSPYFGLAAVAWLLSRTKLASALVLLGSSLTTLIGLAFLARLLIRVDAEAFLYLLLAVGTQWNGVLVTAAAAGVCLLAQWLVGRRGRRR